MRFVRLSICTVMLMAGCRTGLDYASSDSDPTYALTLPVYDFAQALAYYSQGLISEKAHPRLRSRALDAYQQTIEHDPQTYANYSRVADLYMQLGDANQAIEIMQKACHRAPQSYAAHMKLGWHLQVAERYEDAAEIYRETLGISNNVGMVYARLAYVHLQLDQPIESRRILEKGLSRAADTKVLVDTYTLVASELRSTQRFREAADCFQRVHDLRPDDLAISENLIGCYVNAGNTNQALSVVDELAKVEDDLPDNYNFELGRIYESLHQFEKASRFYRLAMDENPEAVTPLFRLASVHIENNENALALTILVDLLKRLPENAMLWTLKGEVHEHVGELDDARTHYQRATELPQTSSRPFIRLAILQLQHEGVETAAQTLTRGATDFSDDTTLHTILGWVHYVGSQYTKALKAFEGVEAIAAKQSIEPDALHNMYHYWYAATCERKGFYDRAEKLFRICIALDPTDHPPLNYVAYMWAEQGTHLDQAFDFVKRALAVEPENGAYIDTLAWICYKQGKHQQALKHIKRAHVLIPDDPVITDHLGDIHFALKHQAAAVRYWKESFRLDPHDAKIATKLTRHGVDVDRLKQDIEALRHEKAGTATKD